MDKYKFQATIDKTAFFSTFISTKKNGKKMPSIRFYRWFCIIFINALFFLSYKVDLQILEGTLSGSRLFGFHLIDPFVALEVFAANHSIQTNLIIGVLTVSFFYFIVGGRAFCSWVCPYNIFGEIGEKMHVFLLKRKIIKSYNFEQKIKYIFWAIFLILAFITQFLVFEIINPVGIISRTIVYGWSLSISIVFTIFLVEVFFSQRAWCRYACPVGTTFGLIGWISTTKIKWIDSCDHCNVCSKVCIVPHVLDITKKGSGKNIQSVLSGDCTLCGRCIEVCHSDALSYETKLKKLI